jgi:ribonuclease R
MTKKKNKLTKNKSRKKKSIKDMGSAKDQILNLMRKNPRKRVSFKQIASVLGITSLGEKNAIQKVLTGLVDSNQIERVDAKFYQAVVDTSLLEGTVDYVNSEYGFVVIGEPYSDIWVNSRNMKNALHGDKVSVKTITSGRKRRQEGEVVEVLEHSKRSFAGTIEISPRFAFVDVTDRKMHFDVFVPLPHLNGAKHGEKVVVDITKWDGKAKNPTGKISKVLGKAGDHDTEIHSIMFEYELPFEFPRELEAEAEKIPVEISKQEIAKRRDMRDITTFTIDPFNAKDFDDALSIRKLENGNWEIGVHIADVTHYVKPDTALEAEALERATSVYLVDRTIPMLPEKLSNGLCSLRPNEEKLTFSVVFEIDEQAGIHNKWFGRTVIYSDRRFTYEEAQERIESGEGEYADEIVTMNELAKKFKKRRFEHGAVSFESVEFVFQLDDDGKTPLGMFPKERKDAHKMIEEFMLLANKNVAEFVYHQKESTPRNTMVYRAHEDPDPERVAEFSLFAKRFGYDIPLNVKKLPEALNKLAEELAGKPEQNIIESQAIRTMSKARYTTEAIGHYGLGFAHYSHFTSPIRRYPDMMAHRMLQHYLDHGKPLNKENEETKCKHSSVMEKRAADAERASIKYKQVEYMQSFIGKQMHGMITGTTEWGMYVELSETRTEGMIRISDIEGDYYQYDAEKMRVIGHNYGKVLRIGDMIEIIVKKANLTTRQVDFQLVVD